MSAPAKEMPNRSMLFVPASNAAWLSTVQVYGADAYMFDLEDSVSLREKDSARLLAYHAIQSPIWRDIDVVVRINPLDTPYGMKDLEAMVRAGAAVIRLPKTDTPEQVHECVREIERIERECGREVGSTKIMAAIESAIGVINAYAIATSTERMTAIALAGFDYVVDMHTKRGDGTELLYARQAVLHAARAAKIACYDVVFGDVNNEEGFLAEVELIKQLGYDGKSLANPRQIHPLHNAYAPTEEELEYAQLVVAAAQKAEEEGHGVVSLNGKMIDAPIITTAQRTIHLAELSGTRKN